MTQPGTQPPRDPCPPCGTLPNTTPQFPPPLCLDPETGILREPVDEALMRQAAALRDANLTRLAAALGVPVDAVSSTLNRPLPERDISPQVAKVVANAATLVATTTMSADDARTAIGLSAKARAARTTTPDSAPDSAAEASSAAASSAPAAEKKTTRASRKKPSTTTTRSRKTRSTPATSAPADPATDPLLAADTNLDSTADTTADTTAAADTEPVEPAKPPRKRRPRKK